MFLIANSSTTKTIWCLFDDSDKQYYTTKDINPSLLNEEEIINILQKNLPIPKDSVSKVYFYGQGCTPENTQVVQTALSLHFEVEEVEVYSYLLGAARSLCGNEEGIVCILGTGSNSCYYDGENIKKYVPSLGFILGDEGSGADLGKKFLVGILKKQFSRPIINEFNVNFSIPIQEVMDNVYRKPFPERYLAQFAPYITGCIYFAEIKELVEDSFSEFIRNNVNQYDKIREVPLHFTGSIAWHFQTNLEIALKKFRLQLGNLAKDPVEGLLNYHGSKNKNVCKL
ncbi:ATPase [Bacteroidia bacterium]|nr:ATPase [Bacteroidia bacterium]